LPSIKFLNAFLPAVNGVPVSGRLPLPTSIYGSPLPSRNGDFEALRGATNNINQIAKRVNSTGVIYKEDIDDIKNEIEHFSKELWQIHSLLLNRTSGDD